MNFAKYFIPGFARMLICDDRQIPYTLRSDVGILRGGQREEKEEKHCESLRLDSAS